MATFEQLQRIARSTIRKEAILDLVKEIPHLNPLRGRHVVRHVAKLLGYDEGYVYEHDGHYYLGAFDDTFIVHLEKGILFGNVHEILFGEEPEEDFDEYDDDEEPIDSTPTNPDANE